MHGIIADADVDARVVASQDAALARLLAQPFDRLVVEFVRGVLDSPRRPPAHVAYDFWRQFRLADELEAVREARPSAFRALPLPPDEAGAVADLGHRA
jgi:hypothetical protein